MKLFRKFGAVMVLAIVYGCAVAPVQQEVQLPSQSLDQITPVDGKSVAVIYNASNRLMFGANSTGRMNISIDGKGVGQLAIGEYVIVNLSAGTHKVSLAHRDTLKFSSTHELEASDQLSFVKIYCKVTSNGLEVTERPEEFSDKFTAAY